MDDATKYMDGMVARTLHQVRGTRYIYDPLMVQPSTQIGATSTRVATCETNRMTTSTMMALMTRLNMPL